MSLILEAVSLIISREFGSQIELEAGPASCSNEQRKLRAEIRDNSLLGSNRDNGGLHIVVDRSL